MIIKKNLAFVISFLTGILLISTSFHNRKANYPILDHNRLAIEYFNEDARWYLENIPFFECSDKQIEQVYYYRWKMYKAHIRNVGDNKYVITEFINHVPWDRDPYCTINAATMHHIYEGRWLKDNRYIDGYINNMYQDAGNNRHYSESVADAAYARFLVNCDTSFLLQQLDSMKSVYNQWEDHWIPSKNLYYIPAMPDATEYTIASIDASGGTGGFDDGEAFRPSINSYMYGNALAIARISSMKGDNASSVEFLRKAAVLKANVQNELWNDSLKHFCDRFKVDNQYVHYWNFIRGRELAGLIPWYFDLPADLPTYNVAWKHLVDTSELSGAFGMRTNEPSYEYYFKQIVYFEGKPGSQWNGPSWPYQTSLVLTGMANFLNDYHQDVISKTDYTKVLRQFAKQHYLLNGKLDLVENYEPNKGGPIVHYYWSNHYNHSTFNNLVITGLCGLRPSESDTLVVNPLADSTINYFCLDDVSYHGHQLSIVFDKDGTRYNSGKGLTVFVDGEKAPLIQSHGKSAVIVGKPIIKRTPKQPNDVALNISHKGFPLPSASINSNPDTSLYQAIDGRIWYFSEITNRWTTEGSHSTSDWYAVDFGKTRSIAGANIYFFADDKLFGTPDDFTVEYQKGNKWLPARITSRMPGKPVPNSENTVLFDRVTTSRLRIVFTHKNNQVAISEVEIF